MMHHLLTVAFVTNALVTIVCGAQLKFRTDGSFKILQMTDLHYGEDEALDASSDQVAWAFI